MTEIRELLDQLDQAHAACPDCLGGIGRRFTLQWPCPTVAAVTAAMTG